MSVQLIWCFFDVGRKDKNRRLTSAAPMTGDQLNPVDLLKDPPWAQNAEAQGFLREAEMVH
jgi:hypothetical protein